MVLSGPSTPVGGGTQPVPQSLLRSNSGLPIPSNQPFSSLVSPRTQFTTNGGNSNSNLSLLGNISNISSSLLTQSLAAAETNPIFQNPAGNNPLTADPTSQSQQLDPMQSFQVQQLRTNNIGPVKLEPQTVPSPVGPVPVKAEPQQMQQWRGLGPVKLERQQSDSNLLLQQQQQQMIQISRQQQQQQMSLQQQQRPHRPSQQQILQQRNLPVKPPVKPPYEPGTCARRLTFYMYHQQRRPEDNNIEYWRKFVAEFFAPNARKRWCVSLYGTGRQTTGVFPQDVWHCEICNRKPGRGFETTVEVLPRLYQIKYASGTQEELLYVDMPREYQNSSGQIVLDYAKAVQESVFDQLRVVREGQLRIVFSPDLKICSWEFCARHHEELIPRRILIPQVSQLGAVVQKYQNATQNSSSTLSAQDLQNTCNSFVASARQLAKALEVPLVNDLGYTKRYVRCLQISEVVNSMKDLIDYSRETRTGPMDSLINYPKRNGIAPAQQVISQQSNGPQTTTIATDQQSSVLTTGPHISSSSANNSNNNGVIISATNSLPINPNPNPNPSPVQIPSSSSSNSIPPPSQPNPSSPFPSPTPSTSNNINPNNNNNSISNPHNNNNNNINNNNNSNNNMAELDPTETQSSVQQILQEMMMSSSHHQLNGFSGGDMKGVISNGPNCIIGNVNGSSSNNMMGYGNLRGAMANNVISMNSRVGLGSHMPSPHELMGMPHQLQLDMGSRLLSGLGPGNGFSNLQFDWKTSP